MASVDKEESERPNDQSANANTSDDCLLRDNYVQRQEEFFDNHIDYSSQRTCCVERNEVHFSEPASNLDTVKADLNEPVINSGSECRNSSSDSQPRLTSKASVQLNEDSGIERVGDLRLKNNDDNSDDEYQSADEGDKDYDNCKDNDQGNEDRFLLLENKDNYADEEGDDSVSDDSVTTKEESDEQKAEQAIIDDLEIRKSMEEKLTEDEKKERKERGQKLKDEGNDKFRGGNYDEAIIAYTEALDICPLSFHKERSIMFANRAACKMKKELYEGAIQDSTSALDLHPHYLKALLRRAELYEKTEKLDEALKDYQKVVELDPSQGMARAACVKLAEQIKDRNEKMKEEMIGKLKDLGNLVLRPFGLSVNNFNLQKDPTTGSYSVQFQQNPPNNGS
ncbi:unnamed protein product [Candidula unifasciata]|uniref:Tetratricopeptide repeat protein 1 n=1 Tax=Candidula unifasciata TaxID=100452 RepID=A0A8S3ZVX9_9EUPU|nr:unnamed protein product [Candidula unifasciata]